MDAPPTRLPDFMTTLGLSVERADAEEAVVRMAVPEFLLSPFGAVQGGAIAAPFGVAGGSLQASFIMQGGTIAAPLVVSAGAFVLGDTVLPGTSISSLFVIAQGALLGELFADLDATLLPGALLSPRIARGTLSPRLSGAVYQPRIHVRQKP